MNKGRIVAIVAVTLFVALLIFTSCSGTQTMLSGRWSMTGIGDEAGQNPQQYPLPVVVDIYPDGRVDMLDSFFGTYTRDRDTYTFVSEDGEFKSTGSFKLEYPNLTIYPDDTPASYIFEKKMDLKDLEKYLASKAAATPTPAAPAATATPAPSAS